MREQTVDEVAFKCEGGGREGRKHGGSCMPPVCGCSVCVCVRVLLGASGHMCVGVSMQVCGFVDGVARRGQHLPTRRACARMQNRSR